MKGTVTGWCRSRSGRGRVLTYWFFNASADRMNTSPLDLPWYRNGCECMDSLRMASVSCLSNSASSSSLAGGPTSTDAGDGGAMVSGGETRGGSARDPLACGRSDGTPRVWDG